MQNFEKTIKKAAENMISGVYILAGRFSFNEKNHEYNRDDMTDGIYPFYRFEANTEAIHGGWRSGLKQLNDPTDRILNLQTFFVRYITGNPFLHFYDSKLRKTVAGKSKGIRGGEYYDEEPVNLIH